MSTRDLLNKLLFPTPVEAPSPVAPGLYHYMRSAGQDTYAAGEYTRFHLRVDPGGNGLLLANASAALHLSPSGVVIAKGLLDDASQDEILGQLDRSFRGADRPTMLADLEDIAARMAVLVAPGDNYPVMNLEDAAMSPFDAALMAPFQADVLAAPPDTMRLILESLWQANIPHVTFLASTKAEAKLLVPAVERAEDLGMIAGVRALASDLSAPSLLEDMALAGLDHCTVPFAASEAAVHNDLFGSADHALALSILEDIQTNEVAPVAEIPLLESTLSHLQATLDRLLEVDVRNINVLAIAADNDMSDEERAGSLRASALPQTADLVEEMAAEMDVRLIWQPPLARDPAVPLAAQLRSGPRCTADVSVRIAPTGDVIPPRGPYRVAGNLLQDDWDDIWRNPVFKDYRERVERPTHCDECPGLAICAADCPREPDGWSQGIGGPHQ